MLGLQLRKTGCKICLANVWNKKSFTQSNGFRNISDSRAHHPAVDDNSRSLVKDVDSGKILVRQNQPQYTSEVDQASSQFSPIPKRLTSVNQQGDIISAAVLSGAPVELQARTVRIYRSAKPATQSGDWPGHHWRIDWDILSKGHRWENPLMGWQSSADFMQGTHMTFKTKDDAIKFAERQGYEYIVHEPNTRKISPKAYANNFLWSNKKLKHIRTK